MNDIKNDLNVKLNLILEQLDKIELGNRKLEQLSVEHESDLNLFKDNKYTKENLEYSTYSVSLICDELGLKDESLSLEELDFNDLSLSFEELNSKRENIKSRIAKKIDDILTDVLDTFTEVPAIFSLLKKHQVKNLEILKDKLNSKELDVVQPKLSSKTLSRLGIFNIFNYNINKIDDLKKWIDLPYTLLVKEKLLNEGIDLAHDLLVVSKDNEKNEVKMKTNKKSLEVFSGITNPSITRWLEEGTKFVIMDKTIGDRVKFLAFVQKGNLTTINNDYFKTGPLTQEFKGYNKKELISLLDTGIESNLKGETLGKLMKESFWKNTFKGIRSEIMTQVYATFFSIFAIKRMFRQFFLVRQFAVATIRIYINQMKSHIDNGELIESIILEHTVVK